MDFPSLLEFIPQHADKWRAEIVVMENTGAGGPLLQALREQHGFRGRSRYWQHPPKGDKETRVMRQIDLISSGRIHLPMHKPWVEDFKHELLSFPNGKYDDQVDAFSQGLLVIRCGCPQPGYELPGITWIG